MSHTNHFPGTYTGEYVFPGYHAAAGSIANFHSHYYNQQVPPLQSGNGHPDHGTRPTIKPSSTVPFTKDPKFVPRPELSDWLSSQTVEPGSRCALYGVGGVGKSQIVIHHAYDVRERSPDTWVFWVHTSSEARFKEAYQKIANKLLLPGRNDPEQDVLQIVCDWLNEENNGPWLMILDNLDDVDVLDPKSNGENGANDRPLKSYLPTVGNGSIIITSRTRDAAKSVVFDSDNIEKVPEMSKEQSVQLLRRRLGPKHIKDEAEAVTLVEALDGMPLAIVQAAAYIRRGDGIVTITSYLEDFRESDASKFKLLDMDAGGLPRDWSAHNCVTKTWTITFNKIHQVFPAAAELLSLMSFFNPQGIPSFALQPPRYGPNGEERNFRQDFLVLKDYSLVDLMDSPEMFEMHPLVQFCTQQWLKRPEGTSAFDKWKTLFLHVIHDKYLEGWSEGRPWPKSEKLESHMQDLIRERPDERENAIIWADLLFCAGRVRHRNGRYQEALEVGHLALGAREDVLGRFDTNTIDSLHQVGSSLGHLRRHEEEETYAQRALKMNERIFGMEHPRTLYSRYNLAGSLKLQVGRENEAEAHLRRVVKSSEILFGKSHEKTMMYKRALGDTRQLQAHHSEAEAIYREILTQGNKTMRSEDPDDFALLTNLASAIRDQDRLEEAGELLRHIVPAKERALGPEHPNTLQEIYKLADLLRLQGNLAESETLHRRVLEARLTVLGGRHNRTYQSFVHLGITLRLQGKNAELDALEERCVKESRYYGIKVNLTDP